MEKSIENDENKNNQTIAFLNNRDILAARWLFSNPKERDKIYALRSKQKNRREINRQGDSGQSGGGPGAGNGQKDKKQFILN